MHSSFSKKLLIYQVNRKKMSFFTVAEQADGWSWLMLNWAIHTLNLQIYFFSFFPPKNCGDRVSLVSEARREREVKEARRWVGYGCIDAHGAGQAALFGRQCCLPWEPLLKSLLCSPRICPFPAQGRTGSWFPPTWKGFSKPAPSPAQPLWGNGAAWQLQTAKNCWFWFIDLENGSILKVLLQGPLNKGTPKWSQEPSWAHGSSWKLLLPLAVRYHPGFQQKLLIYSIY